MSHVSWLMVDALGPGKEPIYLPAGSLSGSEMAPESPSTVIKFQTILQGKKS